MLAALLLLALSVPSVHSAGECEQDTNCILPNCYCEGEGAPARMKSRDIPQMVVVALDGNMDRQRDEHYKQLLQHELRNPNGCRVSTTMFIPGKSTDLNLVKDWYLRGHEIALNSQLGSPKYNFWFNIKRPEMKEQVLKPLHSFVDDAQIPRADISGYRNPSFFTAGNIQYQVLEYEGFQYDASLRVSRRSVYDVRYWPATLDFGWRSKCVVGRCPTNSYPGLWVVPSVAYYNGTEAERHTANIFAYATAFKGRTQKETFDFLWNNFDQFYQNSRAPFILNMNTVGFLDEGGEERIKGFRQFFERILEDDNVYVVSMQQLIDWMKDPTPLHKIKTFPSWSCAESEAAAEEVKNRGKPVLVKQLGRRSKFDVLYQGSAAHSLTFSCLMCFVMYLVQMLIPL